MKTLKLAVTAIILIVASGLHAQYLEPYGSRPDTYETYQRQREIDRLREQLREQQYRAEQERIQRQWRIEQELRNKNDRRERTW